MVESQVPRVSVVMAVYNGAPFLRLAIDSVLAQTFTNFDLIIVDDGSTDETAVILDSYTDPRVLTFTNPTNIGQTRSMNRGLEHVRGTYIARQDADDVSHPTRLQEEVAYLDAHPQVGLIGTSYRLVDAAGTVLGIEQPPADDASLRQRLVDGNVFCHGSVMIRRSCLDAAGGLYHPDFRVTQDYELWLRLAEHCQVANLPLVLYDFRFDGVTVSRQKRGLQLAYQQLAQEMALARRAGQTEPSVPENIVAVYPPEGKRLFGDARRSMYLFFVSGQMRMAGETAVKVRQLLQEYSVSASDWQKWVVGQAWALSDLRDMTQGAEWITWVSRAVPLGNATMMLGQFYADAAFAAHGRGDRVATRTFLWQAVRADKRWLRNRGVWSLARHSWRG